ncbi:unnamed protein product [Fraxinus pennsylvanica]|uniref:Seven-in-absentia protein TRAF-like domain-containing protein n=1 Tax=Fraxinus pennsylvanica TaxID=56036 RepID=A0AAD1ZJM8_9LAMI|nr:unnamed protein product [Fraxinus pennsylvanica]
MLLLLWQNTPLHIHFQLENEKEKAFLLGRNMMLQLFNYFGYHFDLHFVAFDPRRAPVYMAFIHFIYEASDAKKINYSFEVGANSRMLMWQGVPRSIHYSHRTVRESLDGLIIQRNMELFFSGGNSQKLKLNTQF